MVEPAPLPLVSSTVFASRIRLSIWIGLLLVRMVPPALVTSGALLVTPPANVSRSPTSSPRVTALPLLKTTVPIEVVVPVRVNA